VQKNRVSTPIFHCVKSVWIGFDFLFVSASVKQQFHFHIPGDQEGLFKLAVQLRNFFNSVIYDTATGYVLLVYLTNI
jgi:hypothetical protein